MPFDESQFGPSSWPNVFPALQFVEDVVAFIDALDSVTPFKERVVPTGGTLGGNLVLRLGRRQPMPPWLRAVCGWSPACAWSSYSAPADPVNKLAHELALHVSTGNIAVPRTPASAGATSPAFSTSRSPFPSSPPSRNSVTGTTGYPVNWTTSSVVSRPGALVWTSAIMRCLLTAVQRAAAPQRHEGFQGRGDVPV